MTSYRPMPRRWAAFVITVALVLTPTLAVADSCDDLRQADAQNDQETRTLIQDNKGSAAVFIGCFAAGADKYREAHDRSDATATFVVCAGLGCALTDSYSNCVSVNTEIFAHAIRHIDIDDRKREISCQE
jgi:hypothetical protein